MISVGTGQSIQGQNTYRFALSGAATDSQPFLFTVDGSWTPQRENYPIHLTE